MAHEAPVVAVADQRRSMAGVDSTVGWSSHAPITHTRCASELAAGRYDPPSVDAPDRRSGVNPSRVSPLTPATHPASGIQYGQPESQKRRDTRVSSAGWMSIDRLQAPERAKGSPSHDHRRKPLTQTKNAPFRERFSAIWSGKRDSNSRPQPWQGCALPTELFPQIPFDLRRRRAIVSILLHGVNRIFRVICTASFSLAVRPVPRAGGSRSARPRAASRQCAAAH